MIYNMPYHQGFLWMITVTFGLCRFESFVQGVDSTMHHQTLIYVSLCWRKCWVVGQSVWRMLLYCIWIALFYLTMFCGQDVFFDVHNGTWVMYMHNGTLGPAVFPSWSSLRGRLGFCNCWAIGLTGNFPWALRNLVFFLGIRFRKHPVYVPVSSILSCNLWIDCPVSGLRLCCSLAGVANICKAAPYGRTAQRKTEWERLWASCSNQEFLWVTQSFYLKWRLT